LKLTKSLKELIEETERNAVIQALVEANGNKIEAAKLLDISKSTFYEKIKYYNIHSNEIDELLKIN